MVPLERLLDIADGLSRLDPVRDYPRRGAELISELVGAAGYRLQTQAGNSVASEAAPALGDATLSLPLRTNRETLGTLHLKLRGGQVPGERDLQHARWAARFFARGLDYADRLASQNSRRGHEEVEEALERMPLTPREREVVALLVTGSGTRAIASTTGLTVSTVNTYLKRIFAKLGVHSRVELVARLAGTDGFASGRERRTSHVRRVAGAEDSVDEPKALEK